MRFLTKILARIFAVLATVLLIAAGGVLWGPIGPVLVEPLVRRFGELSVPALKVAGVGGTLYSGLTLNGVELTSEDSLLLSAKRVMIRPSWSHLRRGVLWLSDLEIDGVRANMEDLSALAARYGGKKGGSSASVEPIRVTLREITLTTPLYSIQVEEGFLTQDGAVMLSADLGGLPVRLGGALSLDPLEALSVDVSVGTGRAFLSGRLTAPFDVKGVLHSVRLEELLTVFSAGVEGAGEVDGYFTVAGAGKDLEAWGSLRLSQGLVAGIPVDASVPWRYKDGDLVVSQAQVESLSADIELKASADLRPVPASDRLFARGGIRNVSMKKLDRALSLGAGLEGDNGMVDFWVSADQGGRMAGKAFVRLPQLKAQGKEIVKGLRANVFLFPDGSLAADCAGTVFGAKVTGSQVPGTGRAKRAEQKKQESSRAFSAVLPAMNFTAQGLDMALAAAAFPGLASLAPAGVLDLSVKVENRAGRLTVEGQTSSQALTVGGVKINSILGGFRFEDKVFVLEGVKAQIGRAPLDFSGKADLETSQLRFAGILSRFDPKSIPALEQLEGLCDVAVSVEGTTASPKVAVSVTGSQNSVAGFPIRRMSLSGTYENDKVVIPETVLLLPGGSLSFRGEVGLPKGGEPVLNLSGALTDLDLKTLSESWDTDVTGRLEGSLKISGAVSDATLSAVVESGGFSVASTDVRDLHLDFSGTTQNVAVRSVRAKINGGTLEGKGSLTFGRRGKIQVDMQAKGIEIRSLLAQFGVDGVVGGRLDGTLSFQGSPVRPELAVKVTSPLTVKETLLDSLEATIVSPARGKFDMNATGRLGDLTLTLKGHMERNDKGWGYAAESGLLDLDQLVTAKMPSMKGRFSGKAKARVTGRLEGRRRGRGGGARPSGANSNEAGPGEPSPVNVLISLPTLAAAGMELRDISLPIRVQGDQATIRHGTGLAYDGKIGIDADVNMPDQKWTATAKVTGLNIGQAAAPFMKQGAVVGSADVNVRLTGDYGALMMVFANGDFRSGEGYIHKFDVLDKIAEDGRISFKEIRGSFFWDGKDLWLNPGTQATAKERDPLYRYFSVNGPLGLMGKGLALNCKGRFDVHALDMLLGALKSAFQLMTGGLTGGGGQLLRQAVGKLVGYTERDFQDVTFQLKGSWQALQLLNLKIDKSLEGYLPLNMLNGTEQQMKENQKKIQFNITIPTGSGGDDEADTEGQLKKQLIDNIFNQMQF
ncbi:MAG: hypothetical protein LBS00_05720 [Synergistaceae bacterium]|nr:hypothetical protein [Synergistaceae bacterium]